jgi:hypothetical protein
MGYTNKKGEAQTMCKHNWGGHKAREAINVETQIYLDTAMNVVVGLRLEAHRI